MRLVFAGTPPFAVAALDALHAAGHEIAAVYTQPDRPAGRGRTLQASPVAQRAVALDLPVAKPEKLRGEAIEPLRALAPELMVVVAYGLILPQAVLDIPRRGCINIHASLLPRWRGAAPIQRAIEAGDTQTGVTIMQMDAGLDTGPMLLREALAIGDGESAGELQERLAALGARMVVAAVDGLARGALVATPQPVEGATYARKLDKAEARIDWSAPAERIVRAVRAFNPAPMAWTELDGERLRVQQVVALDAAVAGAATAAAPVTAAMARPADAAPGTILQVTAAGIDVAAGDGSVLRLLTLQRPGGRPLPAGSSGLPAAGSARRFT